MKCVICDQTIGVDDVRCHATVYDSQNNPRKVYACSVCGVADGPFDWWVDSLPVNEDGQLISVGRSETKALVLATNRRALEERLREAHSALGKSARDLFGRGHFDFWGRRLIGDNGLILQWQTRPMPDKPVAYLNQQTDTGCVNLVPCED